MKLIKDLGKKRDNKKQKRRYGLFHCEYCNSDVERRIDSGTKQKSCGCMKQIWNNYTFEEWKCIQCDEVKPITEYYKRKESNTYRKECKDCTIANGIARKYGVDCDWYIQKFEEQEGVCEICKQSYTSKRKKRLVIDHNHMTHKVRGLLCNNCNTGIGQLKENITTLENAIKYLNKYNEDIV